MFARLAVAGIAAFLLLPQSASRAAPVEPDLRALLEAGKIAADESPDIAGMTLVDASSRYLKRMEGDIDFPFQVGIDLPVDARPRDLGTALKGPMAETGRYVVVFDVALAKVSRRVRDMKETASRRVVSVNKIENPAFKRVLKLYDRATLRIAKHPDHPKVLKEMEDAQSGLDTTPQYLEQKVYGAYTYKLADVEGLKTLSVNYYLLDRRTGRYMKSVLDVVERERFTIVYDMDPSDPGQKGLRSDFAREDQVKHWERAPVMIELSKLFEHALAQGGPTLPAGDLSALLDGVARDRARAVARAESERYDQRPLNDPRFDGVVVVYTPQGMGSGFYVRSNIVMTNWHVVEGRPIVELRRYDRTETFGQVIAKDVLLDLALVKVQDRGRPLEFFSGKELLPGDQVDAVGHPKRRTFTITRGVVSSIRRMKAGTNSAQGGRETYYIQTDADINPGNSGGPLFKGGKVVGINTFGALHGRAQPAVGEQPVPVPVPGLNFAVHYSEAKRFLDEAMRGGE